MYEQNQTNEINLAHPVNIALIAILMALFAVAGFLGAKTLLSSETDPKKRVKASKTQPASSSGTSSGGGSSLKVQNGSGSLQGGGGTSQSGLGASNAPSGSGFSVQ